MESNQNQPSADSEFLGSLDQVGADPVGHSSLFSTNSSTNTNTNPTQTLIGHDNDPSSNDATTIPIVDETGDDNRSNNNSNSNNNNNSNSNNNNIHDDNDNDNDDTTDFTAGYDRPRWQQHPVVKYTFSVLALLASFLLDLTSADNTSLVSGAVKTFLTVAGYAVVYTTATGQLLWAIAYLMDHGWYLLAVTCSMVLLLGCGLVLVLLEWMWKWRGRIRNRNRNRNRVRVMDFLRTDRGGFGYNHNHNYGHDYGHNHNHNYFYDRLRSVRVLEDDEMEDDWTLRTWIRAIGKCLVTCGVWSLFCALNIRVDFWITDRYREARPEYHPLELRLVNCVEAAPILVGAAVLLCWACPEVYRMQWWSWGWCRRTADTDADTDATTDADADRESNMVLEIGEDPDNDNYTITVLEDDVVVGTGIQHLII